MVVLADAPASRVDAGETLARFLRRYEPSTRVVRSADVALGPPVKADAVFVGFPTQLTPTALDRLQAPVIAGFDYFDEPEPNRDAPMLHADALARIGPWHLKTHRVDAAPQPHPIGLLPIKYNAAVAGAWRRYRWSAPWRAVTRRSRAWDVSLHGSATYLERRAPSGEAGIYDQRVHWLRELRAHPEWRQWGGLLPLAYRTEAQLTAEHGPDVASLLERGPRMPFGSYFKRMTDTRVALCPTGHARWTYRHVESVYAGCAVVSTDLRGISTLVPAPVEAFTVVPDDAPVAPAVVSCLESWEQDADRRASALEHLQTWLDGGRFVAGKRRAFEGFVAQLGIG